MAIFRGDRSAFGAPGIEPQWTHGDKGGMGTAYAASTAHSGRYNSMASVGNPATILAKVNGLMLAQPLLDERPGIGVLYMSGYVEKSMLVQSKNPICLNPIMVAG